MTDQEYSSAPGIRRSDLWRISQSPAHFKYFIENPQPETPSLIFGRALHSMILTPKTWADEYAVAPAIDRRTKAGKEEYERFMELAEGRTIISRDDYEKAQAMMKAVADNPIAWELLFNSAAENHERAFFWNDTATSELCKVKVDVLTTLDDKPVIVDYKTTDSCRSGDFERSARKYGYKFQAGMYYEALFQNTFEEYGFVFVAQEKTPPYAVRVYVCSDEFIAEGVDDFHALMGLYHHCKETGNWFGYEGEDGQSTYLYGTGEGD